YPLAFHARLWLNGQPRNAKAQWSLAMGLLAQGRTREALAVDPAIIPARPAEAGPDLLDLTPYYNQRLDGSGLSFDWDGFVTLKPGLRTFESILFDVRGITHLGGTAQLPNRAFPTSTAPIPVHRQIKRLHMLQFSDFDTTAGTPAGHYLLRYADGQSREL